MSRVVVIGAGLAGLTAASRLAAGGASVTLLSKGIGGLQLGQGTIDVLGYTPDRVTNPVLTLAAVASSRPEHPYAVIGAAGVHTGIEYLKGLLGARAPRRGRRGELPAAHGRRRDPSHLPRVARAWSPAT